MASKKEKAPKGGDKSSSSGSKVRFYMDAEAEILLATAVVELGVLKSNIVCALVRALNGYPPRAGEDRVFAKLKKVFGREQFLAFLKAVGEVLGSTAEPISRSDGKPHDREFTPDAWIMGKTGVLAFYNPSPDNVGQVFTAASSLKYEQKLSNVVVVSPFAETMPQAARDDMERADIKLVSLSGLRTIIAECKKKRK